MSCNICYRDYISCGIEDIVLSIGVINTEYKVVITHPQGSKWSTTKTSDAFGDITIPLTEFPTNLFNPYAGAFTVHLDIPGCDNFLFCDEYRFIEFEMLNGNENKNTLTCCPSGSANDPYMTCCTTSNVTFLNEAITVVPYSGQRPTIEVAYLQNDGTFILGGAGIFNQIAFGASSFTIDHGAVSSGVIKLLK